MSTSTQYVRPEVLEALRHLELSAHDVSRETTVSGRGGYGDIFKGSCTFPGRGSVKVAIKLLRFYLNEDIKKIFEKEIYVWSKLDHANILPLLGYYWEDGTGYPVLVSEWMDNGSAWSYVSSHPDCNLTQLVTGFAERLAYLHEKQVIHSDIKPENIVISESGDARICDFGGARIVAASVSIAKPSSELRGTQRYLAYELIASSDQYMSHTKESDVWAFGMTIFALLTQQLPYVGLSDAQVLLAIARPELPFLPPCDSWSSRRLEAKGIIWNICQLCWDHDPERRAHMAEILENLRNPPSEKDVSRPDDDRDTDRPNVKRRRIANQAGTVGPSAVETLNEAHQLSEDGVLHESLQALFSKLSLIYISVDNKSEIHLYLNLAFESAFGLYEGVSNQSRTDRRIVSLVRATEQAFEVLCDTLSLPDKTENLIETIIRLLRQATECCIFIRQYTLQDNTRRMLDVANSEKIVKLQQSLVDLKEALKVGKNLYSSFVSARTSEKVDTLSLRQRLNPIQMNAFDRPHCLPGTRVDVRNQIMERMLTDTGQNIIWLYGVAGSGKSTISTTIAEYFRGISRLGGFVFFERGKSDPASVIRTIAYTLASFDSSTATQVEAAIEGFSDIGSASAASQFEKLLLEPLTAAAAAMQGPVIVILDALDECGTLDTRRNLLRLISREFPKLPKNFRILITSRSEADIHKALSVQPSVHGMELDYSSAATRDDVLRYIDHEMRTIVANAGVKVPVGWPWDTNMAVFGKTAGGLFIWGSTAVKLVSLSDDPLRKLEELLRLVSSSRLLGGFGLNDLYASVLSRSGISWEDNISKDRFSRVLGLILLSKTPLSIAAIDGILDFPPESSSRLIISRLQSVLVYKPDMPDAPVRLFHASFSDYLMAPERRGDHWFININDQKQMIAIRCFDVMAKLLRFNICNIQTSFDHNDEVEGLHCRIQKEIRPHLEYACRFWAEHLRDVPSTPCLLDKLMTFAKRHLLYWFEVLSLTKHFRRLAGRALLDAVLWTASNHSEISSFLWDAYRLANIFALPISQSTPHIYLSALSLSKGESVVSAHYSKTHPVVSVHRLGSKASTPCMKTFQGHTSSVWSVAFSPDGKHVVSGSWDHSIRVWDAESGEVVAGPFQGHTSSVRSVAFSPDGKRVVSGSSDCSIRVWDAESGEVVSGPFEGHTDSVWSVAFSPDGKRVVSDSKDHSIRVWDAKSEEVLSDPIEVLTENVISVAFSPDRMHSVSCSRDGVINVSNVKKGNVPSGSHEEIMNLDWVLSEEGWILGKQGELLLWIPPDIRPTLWRARNTAVFSCRFLTRLDFTDSMSTLGTDWQKGFNGHK